MALSVMQTLSHSWAMSTKVTATQRTASAKKSVRISGSGESTGVGFKSRAAAGTALAALMKSTHSDCDGLNLFQRQWYKMSVRQGTGLSLEEWDTAARAIAQNSDPKPYLTNLHRLVGHFASQSKGVHLVVRDPERLRIALETLATRGARALAIESYLGRRQVSS
jgi:hypothetical protein